MAIKLIALDGEMTASSLAMGGRIFQIGLVSIIKDGNNTPNIQESFTLTFNPGEDEYYWEEEAEAIHGVREEEMLQAISAEEADEAIHNWLVSQGVDARVNPAVAIGFNVGSFDLPHIAEVLPRTYKLFSGRSIDINALCFTLDGVEYKGTSSEWSGWKRMAKKYAERSISLANNSMYTPEAHNALYDAYMHFYAWQFIQAAVKGEPLSIPGIPTRESDVKRALKELANHYNIEDIAKITGVPEAYIKGWSKGGRATRREYMDAIIRLVKQ
jgi:DNA polymerase III epsilon subunit-like protein